MPQTFAFTVCSESMFNYGSDLILKGQVESGIDLEIIISMRSGYVLHTAPVGFSSGLVLKILYSLTILTCSIS